MADLVRPEGEERTAPVAMPAQPDQHAPATAPGPPGKPVRAGRRRKRFGVLFWLATGWLGIVLFCALTASFLPIRDPLETNVSDKLLAPFEKAGEKKASTSTNANRIPDLRSDGDVAKPTGNSYILGTDGLGRDKLSRLIHGSRVSLIVGFAVVAIGLTLGGTLGLLVGYFRGWLERSVMSVIDVILAFPGLVILLALLAFVGQNLTVIALTIGFLSVPQYTRVARANTLAVAQREYVLAAKAMGAKTGRILFRELLPNVILPVGAFALLSIGLVIVLEGSLAFLGLSVEQPTPTWGSMIAEGKRHLREDPHVAAIPSLVLFLTVLSLNLVGDQLRSIFDVKESGL